MMANRLLAVRLPFGPSMRMTLLLGMFVAAASLSKPSCCVHVIAQHAPPSINVAGQQRFHGFTQHCGAKRRIALKPCLHCHLECAREGHSALPTFTPRPIIRPKLFGHRDVSDQAALPNPKPRPGAASSSARV